MKNVVSIPGITVGRLDPVVGEKILREGKADFIAICKGLMADPEIASKVAAGRVEDIASCAGCGDCSGALLPWCGRHTSCRYDAESMPPWAMIRIMKSNPLREEKGVGGRRRTGRRGSGKGGGHPRASRHSI